MKGVYYIFDKVGKVAFSQPTMVDSDLIAVTGFKTWLSESNHEQVRPEFYQLRRMCTVDDDLNIVDHGTVPICDGTEVNEMFERMCKEALNT